ncbi:MAG: helix-turn-helix transcriptional regulator [Tepidiformaceae bacterium]
MTDGLSAPLVCPVLVGRDQVVADIAREIEDASRPRTILISGEAGVGKSRLLREIVTRARTAGWRAIATSFFERDAESPYSGLRRLLAQVEDEDGARGSPQTNVTALATSGLTDLNGSSSAAVGSDGDRLQLASEIAGALSARSGPGATLFILEDLHWADDASLDAVLVLARTIRERTVLAVSYRPEEILPPLDAFLANLERERIASETKLRRLSLSEVDRMVRAIVGTERAVRADVLHRLFTLSDGNPFLVEEFLRSMLDKVGDLDPPGGRDLESLDIPRGVGEAVRRRTARLSPGAVRLLNVAAVAGTRFDFDLLGRLSSGDEALLVAHLKELIAAGLITEEAPDQFVFRHALTREAIRSGMLAREERLLSAQIAKAIEEVHAARLDAHVEDLAWHYFVAGDSDRAMHYGQLAGERALRLFSPAVAIEHLSRALEAGARSGDPRLGEIHRLRGSAYEAIGEFEAARKDVEIAAGDGDAWVRWRALLQLGLLWASRDYSRCAPYYLEALALARSTGDARAIGQSLERLGNWHANMGDFDAGRRFAEEGLAILREAGDLREVARSLDILGMACVQTLQLSAAVTYFREAATLLESLDDRLTLSSCLASIQIAASTYQTAAVAPAISLAEGSANGRRAVALARESGAAASVAYALWQLTFSLGPQGEYGEAFACAEESLAMAREIGHAQWEIGASCALAALYTDVLKAEEAFPLLERAGALASELGGPLWPGQVSALQFDALMAANRVEEAGEIYAAVAPERPGAFGTRPIYTGGAELALTRGDNAVALAMLEALEMEAERSVPGGYSVRLGWLRGRVLLATGRHEEAVACLGRAESEAAAQGQLALRWRVLASLAGAQLAVGAREAARGAGRRAIEVIAQLGERIPQAEIAGNFVSRATGQIPAAVRGGAPPRGVDGLTAREVEIAGLVARGRTNRDIAEELVLSTRTVETHVANAIGKLGYTSRSQLAAWAVAHGLVTGGADGSAPESP